MNKRFQAFRQSLTVARPGQASERARELLREARRMFTVECEVGALCRGGGSVRVRGVFVDSGAEFTWLPKAALVRAGITVAKKSLAFVLADGRIVKRAVGYAILRTGGFETVDEVVFAELGDLILLGTRTLEGFSAVADVRGKRLIATGPHPAKGNGQTPGVTPPTHPMGSAAALAARR